jgi:hypothetical protein
VRVISPTSKRAVGAAQLLRPAPRRCAGAAPRFAVAHDIHIGRRGIEQHLLLDRQQILLAGRDIGLGARGIAYRPEALEDRLRQADGEARRGVVAAVGFGDGNVIARRREPPFDGRTAPFIAAVAPQE